MCSIVFLATIIFFGFFGTLCGAGQQDFCTKFRVGETTVLCWNKNIYLHNIQSIIPSLDVALTSIWIFLSFVSHHHLEIMTTGYLLFFLVLVIGSTAFLRHTSISYETFYFFHALIAALYLISIIHTFDSSHREGEKTRSQNVKWFSAPLLYYGCDYAMLYINQRFHTEVKSFVAMKGRGGSRMGLMKLRRPTLFMFKPGQYGEQWYHIYINNSYLYNEISNPYNNSHPK